MPPSSEADISSDQELTLPEMAGFLGVITDEVLRRERASELFSYVRQKKSNDRRYPIYQLAPELGPAVVRRYVEMLGHPSGATLHGHSFPFTDPDLGGLTIRELLCGKAMATTSRSLSEEAAELLSRPAEERMLWVEDAANRCKGIRPVPALPSQPALQRWLKAGLSHLSQA